jgi:hypothetical protein
MSSAVLGRCVLVLLASAVAAAPVPAQTGPQSTPREIAARAQKALLVVRSLSADGDTVGSGTGFVVSPDGTFVTNYHVVMGAERLRVELLDGRRFENVRFIAADARHDLAVLQLPGEGHAALALGRDTAALTGDRVYVMGNPLGMSGTFSDGLVSGRRPVQGVGMIQISAPISPGSSGGPVMDDRGQVIGVATLMLMGGQNLNMAVPSRYIAPLLARRTEARAFAAGMVPSTARGGLAEVDRREETRGPARQGRGRANAWREQVLAQIGAARRMAERQGMAEAFPARTGMGRTGEEVQLEYTLAAGVRYLFTARCDEDCANVDLAVDAPGGAPAAADREPDDYPTVAFVAPRAGTYRVTLKVAHCSVEPCAYGVGAYQAR